MRIRIGAVWALSIALLTLLTLLLSRLEPASRDNEVLDTYETEPTRYTGSDRQYGGHEISRRPAGRMPIAADSPRSHPTPLEADSVGEVSRLPWGEGLTEEQRKRVSRSMTQVYEVVLAAPPSADRLPDIGEDYLRKALADALHQVEIERSRAAVAAVDIGDFLVVDNGEATKVLTRVQRFHDCMLTGAPSNGSAALVRIAPEKHRDYQNALDHRGSVARAYLITVFAWFNAAPIHQRRAALGFGEVESTELEQVSRLRKARSVANQLGAEYSVRREDATLTLREKG